MDTLRYTAGGRLGLWDSIPHGRDEFLAGLTEFVQRESHAVIELASELIRFRPSSEDNSLSALTAVCDKIVARGNPTLVDVDWELALLRGPAATWVDSSVHTHTSTVDAKYVGLRYPGTLKELVAAAGDLSCLPYRTGGSSGVRRRPLRPDLESLVSDEEKLFAREFAAEFGETTSLRLHQQVVVRDLIDNCDDEFAQNPVDFVLQIGAIKWVIEVDGAQHEEKSQRAKDTRQRDYLESQGWSVKKVDAKTVRSGLDAWFGQLRARASARELEVLRTGEYASVEAAIASSPVHAAALNCLLVPHAFQRCMRGLLLLYSNGILDPVRPQRILVVEEDLPVTTEAFRALRAMWARIHAIAPVTPHPPRLEIDVIGTRPEVALAGGEDMAIRYLDQPDGRYDVALSHSYFLDSGHIGATEAHCLASQPADTVVALRHAVGFHAERSLQWSDSLQYDLADVEVATLRQAREAEYPMPSDKHEALLFLLRLIFRKADFWEGQLRVICRLLQRKPSIVLLPTGGGKSLTYQMSGLLLPGMTVVIDPLVSLMADQVENLNAMGIDMASHISGQLEQEAKDIVLRDMELGRLSFIFISPERLQGEDFRNQLQSVAKRWPVSLAVIDEAHCVSEWGHDFRPSYLHMPRNLQRYCSDKQGRTPTLVGLTGTASFAVLTDIQTEMQIAEEEAIVLPRSFDRSELCFAVRSMQMTAKSAALKSLKMELPRILRANPQHFYDLRGSETNCGIVFCPNASGSRGVISVAALLGHGNYFAGQKPREFAGDYVDWNRHKDQVQRGFKKNALQELVATKSFGMGIDKPNIRYTVHYGVPQSVEAFYQEAGRAGRNGKAQYALCTILYSDDNWDSALQILNDSDHRRALSQLKAIRWDDRGDVLVQLWLLFNSYAGREVDKLQTMQFWTRQLAPALAGMAEGATNTVDIAFSNQAGPQTEERAIFRLMLVGVVQDYTIDWRMKRICVKAQKIAPNQVKDNLRKYLMQYKFEEFADRATRSLTASGLDATVELATDILIDFIYDEVVAKRKQALRTMGDLCRNFQSDQRFREAILAYLQESEFSEELRTWIGGDFASLGLDVIHDLLARVSSLEEVKRLVGTTRRMLDNDPGNTALRYLSLCARLQSTVESDASVIQEAATLALQIAQRRDTTQDTGEILFAALQDTSSRRPHILEQVGDTFFRRAGSRSLARLVLASDLAKVSLLYGHAIKLLVAGAVRALADCGFDQSLTREGTIG